MSTRPWRPALWVDFKVQMGARFQKLLSLRIVKIGLGTFKGICRRSNRIVNDADADADVDAGVALRIKFPSSIKAAEDGLFLSGQLLISLRGN